MSEAATKPVVRPKLDLNRKNVKTPTTRTGPEFLDFEAYGTYEFALRQFQYKEGARGKPFYLASVVVLTSTNPTWPPGREAGLYFSTGRMGEDADRDDVKLVAFLRAVGKLPAAPADVDAGGKAIDNDAELEKALNAGRMEHDNLPFRMIRGHSKPEEKPILDSKKNPVCGPDGKPMTETVQYTRDSFEIVS